MDNSTCPSDLGKLIAVDLISSSVAPISCLKCEQCGTLYREALVIGGAYGLNPLFRVAPPDNTGPAIDTVR